VSVGRRLLTALDILIAIIVTVGGILTLATIGYILASLVGSCR